jgi:hypothetical protein
LKLYVDGCSFVAASGISSDYKMAKLLNADKDMSLEGKSNLQIVHDVYKNIDNYSHFFISFTFSNRFVIFENGKRCFHILPNLDTRRFPDKNDFEKYKAFHDFYYRHMNLDFNSALTDFYVDSIISMLKFYNKTYLIYTVEPRKTKFPDELVQLDFLKYSQIYDGHFDEQGMQDWAKDVKRRLF